MDLRTEEDLTLEGKETDWPEEDTDAVVVLPGRTVTGRFPEEDTDAVVVLPGRTVTGRFPEEDT
ncbi:MAG: hypothetical protein IKC08_05980, partial [Lentisphaeria bacterium]|nr:hypothetical protein [Lentisphaeria bacterium]